VYLNGIFLFFFFFGGGGAKINIIQLLFKRIGINENFYITPVFEKNRNQIKKPFLILEILNKYF